MDDFIPDFTPVQKIDGIYFKRDDLYCRAGIRGGKVRACWHLATRGPGVASGLITASARKSPQAQIVARIAKLLGIPARLHMPAGAKTEEMLDVEAHGGEIIQHKAGYNNVIVARAGEDFTWRRRMGWRYIPFGMEHPDAMQCTRNQVKNIPPHVKRIVICIGSGMSTAGVLHGLQDRGLSIPVLGIRVGADPKRRLSTFAPFACHELLEIVNVTDTIPYHTAVEASIGGIELDPHYEAKCAPYVEPGDLFWIVGIRAQHKEA